MSLYLYSSNYIRSISISCESHLSKFHLWSASCARKQPGNYFVNCNCGESYHLCASHVLATPGM